MPPQSERHVSGCRHAPLGQRRQTDSRRAEGYLRSQASGVAGETGGLIPRKRGTRYFPTSHLPPPTNPSYPLFIPRKRGTRSNDWRSRKGTDFVSQRRNVPGLPRIRNRKSAAAGWCERRGGSVDRGRDQRPSLAARLTRPALCRRDRGVSHVTPAVTRPEGRAFSGRPARRRDRAVSP